MSKILLIIILSFIACDNLRSLSNFNWDQYYDDLVNTHNSLRAKHGVGKLIKDKKLEQFAQDTAYDSLNAETLKYGDIYKNGEFLGINLYLGSGNARTGKYVAEYWYSENYNYSYSTGKSRNGSPVSHFTQLVWKNTKKIGCAVAIGRWKIYSQSYYICCYYSPGGNLSGRFTQNVFRPNK